MWKPSWVISPQATCPFQVAGKWPREKALPAPQSCLSFCLLLAHDFSKYPLKLMVAFLRLPNPAGYSGFDVTGMIKGFIWVWNFWFWDFFWVGKIWQVYFWVAWKVGIFFLGGGGLFRTNYLKICGSACITQPRSCAIKFNQSCFPFWRFFDGLIFGPGLFWVLLELGSPRDFFRFWFLAPFGHPCHLKYGVPPLRYQVAFSHVLIDTWAAVSIVWIPTPPSTSISNTLYFVLRCLTFKNKKRKETNNFSSQAML